MEEYNESSTGSIIVGGNKNNSSSKGRFLSAEGTSPLIDSVNCQREPEIDLSTGFLHQAAATFNNVVMLVLLFLIFGLSNSAFLALSFYFSSFLCIFEFNRTTNIWAFCLFFFWRYLHAKKYMVEYAWL